MGKAIGTIAKAIGAVALIATGGAIGIIAGAALASSAINDIAGRPKPPEGGTQIDFTADPNAGVPYLMGRTGTAGNIILRRASDGWSANTPNDLHDIVTVFSGAGPVDGLESFTSDKVAISFDGAGNAIGDFRDKMFMKVQRGLRPEPSRLTVQAGLSAAPTGWTVNHKLSGFAAAMWRLRYDSKQRFFQNGVPQPIWVWRGVSAYDPRLDSTYPGGSGPQRWNDESTWAYTENPALHGLTWCIGRHANGRRVMGLGAHIDHIIVSQFVEAANVADANGWKIGGVIYSRPDTKWNNLKLILQACAAEPLRIGGRIGCMVQRPRVSLVTITEADLAGEARLTTIAPRRSRLNTVIPRYRSEANDWQMVPAAPIAVAAHITADGEERSREIEYVLVQQADQAACLARYDIENSREFGPGTLPLKLKFLNYRPGDCVTVQLPGLTAQKMLLMNRAIDPVSAAPTFTVRSENDGKHAFALAQTGTPPPPSSVAPYDPVVAAPAAGDWSLAGVSLTAGGTSLPALELTGTVGNSLADAVIWEQRLYDAGAGPDDNWVAAGSDPPTATRRIIGGVAAGASYEVSVQYRVRGIIGARRVLGPVTAGALQVQSGARTVASQTVAFPITSDDTSMTIVAYDVTLDNSETISLPADTVTGLSPGTSYGVFWNIDAEQYELEEAPAPTRRAMSGYVFLQYFWTSTSGSFPPADEPPPGWAGIGEYPRITA